MKILIQHRFLSNHQFLELEREVKRSNDWIIINDFLTYQFDRIEDGQAIFKSQLGHDAVVIDQAIWEELQ